MKPLGLTDNNNNKKKRILMVDDETDVNYTFETVLEENGFVVDSFDNPVVALNNFKPDFYDLVLLDVKMPDMDGFKLYKEMKKIDNKFKVCFLTASEMFYEQYRPAYSVMTGENYPVIQKPIKNEDFIEQINEILAKYYTK
ncbi:MAG TPA: response regulator [Nitrososphaeraceae archaeon]|nr:response regulator [Nitrososphaeraceae archaeon]